MGEIESRIVTKIEGPLKELGYSVYDIKFKSGKDATLSIVIDRKERIGLDDIVKVSEALSALLDEDDPIDGPYTLDVSSAGAEKTIALEQLGEYLNCYVNLHLSHPCKGENIVEGTLLKLQDGEATLLIKDKSKKKEISFPSADIDRARLAIEF